MIRTARHTKAALCLTATPETIGFQLVPSDSPEEEAKHHLKRLNAASSTGNSVHMKKYII